MIAYSANFWLATLVVGWAVASSNLDSQARAAQDQQTQAPRLGLDELAAYRQALQGKPAATLANDLELPVAATALMLEQNAPRYQGRRVVVEGRVARAFHQPALGDFPALVELWLTDPKGHLCCVVCPDSQTASTASPAAPVGETVRFTGTFLRKVGYPSERGERHAPLIVGPGPTERLEPAADWSDRRAQSPPPSAWTPLGWLIALPAAGVIVLWGWWSRSVAKPRKARIDDDSHGDPPIQFIEPQSQTEDSPPGPGQ